MLLHILIMFICFFMEDHTTIIMKHKLLNYGILWFSVLGFVNLEEYESVIIVSMAK